MSTPQPTIEELAAAAARECANDDKITDSFYPFEVEKRITAVLLRHLQPLAKDRERMDAIEEDPSNLRWNEETELWDFSWRAGKGYGYGYSAKSLREAADAILSTPKPASSS